MIGQAVIYGAKTNNKQKDTQCLNLDEKMETIKGLLDQEQIN